MNERPIGEERKKRIDAILRRISILDQFHSDYALDETEGLENELLDLYEEGK